MKSLRNIRVSLYPRPSPSAVELGGGGSFSSLSGDPCCSANVPADGFDAGSTTEVTIAPTHDTPGCGSGDDTTGATTVSRVDASTDKAEPKLIPSVKHGRCSRNLLTRMGHHRHCRMQPPRHPSQPLSVTVRQTARPPWI